MGGGGIDGFAANCKGNIIKQHVNNKRFFLIDLYV
jgi:hypothetical protein